MTYFKINGNDYSMYVNKLLIGTEHNYKQMTTAAGNTIVKYINSKRTIEVGIIPLDAATMSLLMKDIKHLEVLVSYKNPDTGNMVENLKCIIPNNLIEYHTIQAGKVTYKAFSLQIKEL